MSSYHPPFYNRLNDKTFDIDKSSNTTFNYDLANQKSKYTYDRSSMKSYEPENKYQVVKAIS
jgi:hypothetical protein